MQDDTKLDFDQVNWDDLWESLDAEYVRILKRFTNMEATEDIDSNAGAEVAEPNEDMFKLLQNMDVTAIQYIPEHIDFDNELRYGDEGPFWKHAFNNLTEYLVDNFHRFTDDDSVLSISNRLFVVEIGVKAKESVGDGPSNCGSPSGGSGGGVRPGGSPPLSRNDSFKQKRTGKGRGR